MTTKPASTRTEATSTEGAQRVRDRKIMRKPLAEIADRWAREEQQLDSSELEIRYRWAKDVKSVHESPDLYGANAVEALFEVRMTTDHEPRVYKSVATYIDDTFFDLVITFNQTKSARRGHITWSHLVVFARLGDPDIRQSLLEQCMAEQWSVATLRNKVDEAFDDGITESTAERRQAGFGTLVKRITRSATKLAKDVAIIFSDGYHSQLESVRDGDRGPTAVQVADAKVAVSELLDQLGPIARALDDALKVLVPGSHGIKAVKADATESAPPVQTADGEPLPATPRVKRKKIRVRRRIQPVVDSSEMATV